MTTRAIDLLDAGVHASRPAVGAAPVGALYSCTDHALIYQNDGATWNTWATITGGGLDETGIVTLVNDDTTPSALRAALDAIYSAGGAGTFIASPGTKSVGSAAPSNSSTTVGYHGLNAFTATGAATSVAVATTNGHTSTKRLLYRQTASTSAVAGWRGDAVVWRGNAAGLGGFKAQFRFGPDTGQTIAGRMFTGLTVNTGTPSDVEPSTLVDCVGVGYDAADTQLYVIHNDSAGAATKVATGLTRSSVDSSQVYSLTIECAPNGSSIDVTILDELASTVFATTVSTELPANTSFLTPRSWCSVGGVNSVIGMAFMGYYYESSH